VFNKNNKTQSLKAFRFKNRESLVISEPFGFKHIQHIGIDGQLKISPTSNQFTYPASEETNKHATNSASNRRVKFNVDYR